MASTSSVCAEVMTSSGLSNMVPQGHRILTAEFKTNLLRGARGEWLVCEVWMLKPGRQIMFAEAEIYAVSGNQRQLAV
ncbi:MAG: hypothetical protein CFE43_00870 [Burkholderiales bacterium PBB3]|nr:MAG: hypothetical protein CFE43_00870 [Burkholderiales bacterium PBB3]